MSTSRNYGQIDDFPSYTSKEEWEEYIKTTVVPLWESTWVIKEFHNRLQNEFDGRPFDTLSNTEKRLFLGGIEPRSDDPYRRRSIAAFYKALFGAQVTDLQSWILSNETGVEADVEIEVEESPFVEFAEKIHDCLTTALSAQYLYQDYLEPDVGFQNLLEQPDELRELVEECYQQILNFAVNNSYHTFFLWSLNQVPRHFLQQAYPDLEDRRALTQDEFGLMNLDWNNPIKRDSDIFDDYRILCYPEYNPNNQGNSFGGSICRANEIAWEYFHSRSKDQFRNALSQVFNMVPDLKEQYHDQVENRVTDVPDNWKNRNFTIYYKNLSASTEGRSNVEDSSESIMDLLDQAAPLLFLGLHKIGQVRDNRLNIEARSV